MFSDVYDHYSRHSKAVCVLVTRMQRKGDFRKRLGQNTTTKDTSPGTLPPSRTIYYHLPPPSNASSDPTQGGAHLLISQSLKTQQHLGTPSQGRGKLSPALSYSSQHDTMNPSVWI